MTKITDEELRLPDVTLVMTEAQLARLPREIWEELRLFGGRWVDGKAVIRVPGYRYRLWVEMAKGIQTK